MGLPDLVELSVLRIRISVDEQDVFDVHYAGGSPLEERVRQGLADLQGQHEEILAKATKADRTRPQLSATRTSDP
jgi:hypothetical protein